eukprot:scaffold12644_cov43-Cyclotella_meneghiniana.AAC.2
MSSITSLLLTPKWRKNKFTKTEKTDKQENESVLIDLRTPDSVSTEMTTTRSDKQGPIKTEKQKNNIPRTLVEAMDTTATPGSVSSEMATTQRDHELQVLQKADVFPESSYGSSPAARSKGINDSIYMKLMAEDDRNPSTTFSPAARSEGSNDSLYMNMMGENISGVSPQDVKVQLQRAEEFNMQILRMLDQAARKHDELISKLDRVLESKKSTEKAVITKEVKAMKKELEKLKKDNRDLAEKNKRLESSKKELASRNAEIAKEHAKLLREKKKNSRLRP